jgi:hypothetical protein
MFVEFIDKHLGAIGTADRWAPLMAAPTSALPRLKKVSD